MLSDKLTNLERNRYFFGKLLTANDFNAEQDYFNNKRRLLNRLTFGAGVVLGMEVIKAGDSSLAVESGLALDATGREIVLSRSVVKKLSSIEGFNTIEKDGDENIKSVYLCAEYSEEYIDPVHSVAKDVMSDENDGTEHNRIRESCKLYLTSAEPSEHPFEPYSSAKVFIPVWSGDGVEISISAPRFIRPSEEFFLETRIKKGSPKQQIYFNLNLELDFLTVKGKHTAELTFLDTKDDSKEEHIILTPVCTASSNITNAKIKLRDINVSVNGFKRNALCEKDMQLTITKNSEYASADFLRKRNLEECLSNRPSIYLARLCLMLTPDYYIIDKIENLPFGQALLTPMQAESLRLARLSGTPIVNKKKKQEETETEKSFEMNTGSITISIPQNCIKGGKYYSKAIPHFLGVGEVMVSVAMTDSGEAFFGGNVFNDYAVWDVKTDKERGLFTVGVKLKKRIPDSELTFDWYAIKKIEPKPLDTSALSIFPDVYFAHAHETIAFETRFSGSIEESDLIWSVVPETGGRITKNGVFTASGRTGFYEIRARSYDGKLGASAFVVI